MDNIEIVKTLSKIGITEKELVALILEEGEIKTLDKNTPVISEGTFIKEISIVLDGEVRVWKNAEDGKEILLYYVTPVQTCVMSVASSFRDKISTIDAETIRETTVLSFPVWGLDKWMKHEQWRTFIVNTFIHSYDDIIQLYSELAFNKLDVRLIKYFQQYKTKYQTSEIPLSHNDLAKELGTSREVISRILKNMEQEQKIKLGLKKIVLL